MLDEIFPQFVTLWVVIDPIGTIPVFVAVSAGMEASMRPRLALHAAAIASGVLMFFLIAGQFLIDALGISLNAKHCVRNVCFTGFSLEADSPL